MCTSTRLIVILLAALCLLATKARADSLLSVGGTGDRGHAIDDDEAAAASFTLANTYYEVAIRAELSAFASSEAIAFLMTNIGAGAGFSDVKAYVDLSGSDISTEPTLLFDGLTLSAGDYFLVVSTVSGFLYWEGSSTPIVTAAPGVVHGVDFFTDDAETFPPFSRFDVLFDRAAHFTIHGTSSAPVPEPASLTLFAVGFLGFVSRLSGKRVRRAS